MGQPDYILDQFGKPRDAAMLISLSSVVCDVLYSGETDGPIRMKFSGKLWSDHGTTWFHFGLIRVNRAMLRC